MTRDASAHSVARLLILGAMAALFFSSTFVLNRAMSLDGGPWVWSASLRYAFMLPILLLWTLASGGPRAVAEALRLFGRNPLFWTLAGSVGFGFALGDASAHGRVDVDRGLHLFLTHLLRVRLSVLLEDLRVLMSQEQ